MNKSELRAELDHIIQDQSYTPDQLDMYIHQACLHIAGAVLLPDLKRLGSVDTVAGQAYTPLTAMTTGFGGRLSRVHKDGVAIYPNLDLLIDAYNDTDNESLDTAGAVEAVALEGNNLWYQYVPATPETLIITYYIDPPALTDEDDIPTYLPTYLHYPILVNGAAYMIYDQIEDGEDEEGINAIKNFIKSFDTTNPKSGINELMAWISRNRIPYISSRWSD